MRDKSPLVGHGRRTPQAPTRQPVTAWARAVTLLSLLALARLVAPADRLTPDVVPSGVVPVTTEAELVAAVTNNSVPGAHLTNNLKLTANGWPATAISRTSNFTVFGGELFPILDLSFIEGKIQLAPGVLFAFRQVELRNVRQRSGFEVDIFAASPNATVRFDGTVHFAFSCLPMDSLMAYMMGTPPASLPQDIRLSTWCRPQPALARCYGNASTLLLRSGSGLLEVVGFTGVTSGGGYVLEAYRDAYFVCENPVTEEECSAGYNNCVESKIARLYGNDTTWQRLAQWDQAHTQESPSSPSTTTAAAPSPQPAGDDSSNSSTVAAAVGGAVGGAVGLALVAALALFLWRRRSAPRSKQGGGSEDGGGKPGEVCILVAPAAGPGATSAANGNGAGPTANGNGAVSLGTTQTEADSSTGNEATGAMSMSLVNLNASTVAHTPAANGSPYAAGGAAAGCPVVLKPPLGAAVAARAMLLPHEAGGRVPALTVANSNRSSAASVVQVAGIYVELGAQLGAGSFGKVFRGTWQGRPVAVKVLQYGAELCRAVRNEVALSQNFRHPNVVASLCFAQLLPGGKMSLYTNSGHNSSTSVPLLDASSELCKQAAPASAADGAQPSGQAPASGGGNTSLEQQRTACEPADAMEAPGPCEAAPCHLAAASPCAGSAAMRINPDGASAPLVCKGPGDALETAGQELGSARAQADRTLSAPFLPSLLSALAAAHPTVLPRSKSDSTGGPRASITLRDLGTLGLDLDLDLDLDPAQNDERESASAACASPRHSPVLARWTEQRRQQAEVEEGRAPPAVRPSRISPNGLMAMSQIGKPATASGRAGADSGPGACTVSITLAPEGVPSTLSVAPMSQGTPPSSYTLAPVPPSSVAGAAAASLPVEALWLAAHTHPAEGCSHGFLVMELCEGGSVALWRGGRWKEPGQVPDMATLLTVALDIAYGMAYLHSQGVCHGDLKLSNVLLARSGSATSATSASPAPDDALAGWSAKLCDFGLSRVLTGERTHVSTRPHGTPTHMAPELWAKGHVSQPADVYAFGITLWELATGQRPYKGLTAANILHRVMLTGGRPVLPLWLPRAYIDLTTACWAQSPKERPGAAEVVRRLEALLTALGTAVAPPSLPSALAVGES